MTTPTPQTPAEAGTAKAVFQSAKNIFTAKGEVKASHALIITGAVALLAAGIAYYIRHRKAKKEKDALTAELMSAVERSSMLQDRLGALGWSEAMETPGATSSQVRDRILANLK